MPFTGSGAGQWRQCRDASCRLGQVIRCFLRRAAVMGRCGSGIDEGSAGGHCLARMPSRTWDLTGRQVGTNRCESILCRGGAGGRWGPFAIHQRWEWVRDRLRGFLPLRVRWGTRPGANGRAIHGPLRGCGAWTDPGAGAVGRSELRGSFQRPRPVAGRAEAGRQGLRSTTSGPMFTGMRPTPGMVGLEMGQVSVAMGGTRKG